MTGIAATVAGTATDPVRSVLVVGSGAREHALCWRLARDPRVERVLCAPGNPLMADVAEPWPEVATTDTVGLVGLARRERVDLVVVGPEGPLVGGLVDALATAGVTAFGPGRAAARIEGSKQFCREIATAADVPMAVGAAFDMARSAIAFAERFDGRVVVKADGLAAGKGVIVCDDRDAAEAAIRSMLEEGTYGEAGATVVVEERLTGQEVSVIAITDGSTVLAMPAARDHKRLEDGDRGPNTGGMGALSPVPDLDGHFLRMCLRQIHEPVLAELARRRTPFRGALYAGLMLTAAGPRLLEFNARLGDPEAQAILPRLDVELAPLLAAAARAGLSEAAASQGIDDALLPASAAAAVAVVLAAPGYPGAPQVGAPIEGIDEARDGALVFGAGLAGDADGSLVTAGGRVLTVVGRGVDLGSAAQSAYAAADRIRFPGRQLRRDIGREQGALAGASAGR